MTDFPPSDRLPLSREADLRANREARFSGRQMVGLVYSGLWRLLIGLPAAAAAAAIAWNHDFWAMAVGMGFFAGGLYLAWRGFSFLGDVLTRNVAYVDGRILSYTSTYKGITSYYLSIGPVAKRISRKKYDSLPNGLNCFAYYASGSRHLLSLEPYAAAGPHPALGFGGDAAHAWDRLRWPLVLVAVGAFGVVAGVHGIVTAHPARTVVVSGTISSYVEHHGKSTYRTLYLAESSEAYSMDDLGSYSPPIPYLSDYAGSHVDLYVNSDNGSSVIALRLREVLHQGDYYLHPEDQTQNMIISGALIAAISGAGLLAALWWQLTARRSRLDRLRDYAASVSSVTSMRGL